jgi:hypothetical protein
MHETFKIIAVMTPAAALTIAAAYASVATLNSSVSEVSAQPRKEPTPALDMADSVAVSEQRKTNDDEGNQQFEMFARGSIAMGFDQNKIMHHFMATPTGGQITIVSLDSNDNETISQIRTHVLDIQKAFARGNFTKPFFIHAQEAPGTKVMTERKN